jgi:hypothetical protein
MGPNSFGNLLSVYFIDGGYIQLYLGMAAQPRDGEKFRLALVPNRTFTAFVLSEQTATLYFPASVYGASMTGVCKLVQ